jgi:hypothetical protein
MAASAWVDAYKLPFLSQSSIREVSAENCAAHMSQVIRCNDYIPIDAAQPFAYRASSCLSGDCAISSVVHTPVRVATQDQVGHAFVFSEGEGHRARVGNDRYNIDPGAAIFIPQEVSSVEVETGNYAGIAISLTAESLAGAFNSFNPLESHHRDQLEGLLSRPAVFSPCQHPETTLLNQFKMLVALVDSAIDIHGLLPACFPLGDLLAVRIAALLMPDMVSGESVPKYEWQEGRADPRFDELIDYIRDHLSQPLSLTDLSINSGLSRSQLAQAFQHHFGCSAMTWIHQERIKMLSQVFFNR